ncbi:MAG: fumarylacetoacetate hydrolase family protein [Pseudomonadota bacterium]
MTDYVFPPAAPATLAVHGLRQRFPVHRIYCIALNYAAHDVEMGGSGRTPPSFFMKPADAVVAAAGPQPIDVPYPSLTCDLHHEVELVVAIGRGGRDIPLEEALDHVWGYAVGLDMTRRDLQAQAKQGGRPWCVAKGFDASAPVGLLTPAADVRLQDAAIALSVNGQPRQASTLGHMTWKVPEIIAQLSRAWALQPGDLIFTGTPEGVGPVQAGDLIESRIDGLVPLAARIV